MSDDRRLQVEGELKVVETTGTWGVYAGERVLVGSGESFRDDLGIRIREMFETGAREQLEAGGSPSESFSLPRVRITIELLDPEPPTSPGTS